MSDRQYLTTREVATRMRIDPTTIHKRLHAHGDFWRVLPVRGPNGRLLWPVEAIEALLEQRTAEQAS